MTDETPETARSVKVWVCTDPTHEDRQCFALVEDTRDSRIAHRAWHAQQSLDREALRGAIKERDEKIVGYRNEVAEFRRIVAGYEQTVAGLHGEVRRVETPTAPPALEISRDTYDDDQPDEAAQPSWARYEPEQAQEVPEARTSPAEPADDGIVDGEPLDDDDPTHYAPTTSWAR